MNDETARPPPTYSLKAALICSSCAIAGLLLAFAGVYVGTGWLDGFDDWDLHRLGRRLRSTLLWSLPLSMVGGLLLYDYFRHALAQRAKGWLGLLGAVRAFALFPLIGFGLLLFFLLTLILGIGSWVLNKLFGLPTVPDDLLERLLGTLLWYLTLPFTLLGIESRGDIRIPVYVSRKRLLCWLPGLFVLLMFWCGAEAKGSHDRVDPYWLAAIAAYWFGDYLIAAFYVSPQLAKRKRGRRTS